jgi:peptidoglycan/xylan/chitin deacetylase (PgdA/CDA1 family)
MRDTVKATEQPESETPPACAQAAAAQLRASPSQPVPILTYHNIGCAPDEATHSGLYLSPEKFHLHLKILERHGYLGVSMEEGLPFLRGEKRGRIAILTFDDGYLDTFEEALPALLDRRFTATCYFVAGGLGGFNAWDSDEVRVRKPLMDLHRARRWLAAGMGVGSHTVSHPRLTQLDRHSMQREIFESKTMLEQALGIPVDHFCFPYGDHDAACVGAVTEAGYSTAVTTRRGVVRCGANLHALPRVGNSGKRSANIFRARTLLWALGDGDPHQ